MRKPLIIGACLLACSTFSAHAQVNYLQPTTGYGMGGAALPQGQQSFDYQNRQRIENNTRQQQTDYLNNLSDSLNASLDSDLTRTQSSGLPDPRKLTANNWSIHNAEGANQWKP